MVEAVVQYDYTAREPDELTIRKGDIISDIRMQDGGWWEGSLNGKRGMFPDNFVKIAVKAESNGQTNEVNLRTSGGRRCKVLYSYQPNNEDELALEVNDIIEVLAEVEDGWWKGSLRNKIGVFPSNFVKEIVEKTAPDQKSLGSRKSSQTQPPMLSHLLKDEDKPLVDGDMATDSPASPTGPNSGNPAADHIIDAPTLPPKPGAMKEQCRALFPYAANNDDELTLQEGDIITILSKKVQDEGWWKGVLRGKVGVFPDNFVQELPPVPVEEPQQIKPERPPAKVVQGVASGKGISKPSSKPVNSTTGSSGTGSLTKKPSEVTSKSSEEKVPTASVAPVLNKKPLFPPTAKKPQLRPVSAISLNSTSSSTGPGTCIEQRHGDFVDGAGSSRVAPPHENGKTNEDDMDFDGVERGAMLTHPTARRARAPGRRPPSSIFNKDSEVWSGLVNGNSDHDDHEPAGTTAGTTASEQNNDSSEGKESTTTRSKEWEKHKAPWMEELKQNQAKKIQHTRISPISSPTTKTDMGRKSDGGDMWSSPSTPETVKSTSSLTRPHSVPNNGTVAPRSVVEAPRSVVEAPRSVVEAPRSVGRSPRTSMTVNSSVSPGHTETANNSVSEEKATPAPLAGSGRHLLEVEDRVSKLESLCEVLTHQIATLKLQLKEESEKRCVLQMELDKIADLVTQV